MKLMHELAYVYPYINSAQIYMIGSKNLIEVAIFCVFKAGTGYIYTKWDHKVMAFPVK
jgi:hypothetical protein